MLEVHISKHSLFRLKITVGCLVRVCGVVKLGSLSLSCSLSFLFSFPFFFSLIFLFLSFSFSFSLAPSLTLALALVLTLYKALINKHGVQL